MFANSITVASLAFLSNVASLATTLSKSFISCVYSDCKLDICSLISKVLATPWFVKSIFTFSISSPKSATFVFKAESDSTFSSVSSANFFKLCTSSSFATFPAKLSNFFECPAYKKIKIIRTITKTVKIEPKITFVFLLLFDMFSAISAPPFNIIFIVNLL